MGEELYNAYYEKITLTKEQEACLNYTGNRTLMVKGLAGSGKSLVIQVLARKYLADYSEDKVNRVAIFTFSNTLNSATKELLKINGEQEKYIKVTTLSSYISAVYNEMKAPRLKIFSDPLYTKVRKEAVQEALNNHKKLFGFHRFHNMDLQFWLEEFEWMKDMNISVEDMHDYLKLQRKGRGGKVRMSAADRVIAFQIFSLYDEEMKKRHLGEWVDHSLYLVRHGDEIPDKYKFDYILLDEAQDFSFVQMMSAMMFFRKGMVVALDMNQRIFDKQWTPKLLGIETTTKKLTKSMRTTKQIDDLAESIRKNNDAFLSEEDKSLRAIPEMTGPIPQLVHLDEMAAEKKYVIENIKAWLKQKSNISIGLIAAQNKQITTFAAWMTDAGIPHEIIKRDSSFSVTTPGVKIVNVYNAKGLEFTRVVMPQFIEGNYPYKHKNMDEEEKQLFLNKCRNLIYVAMTRAKFSLLITYSGDKGSRFIGEMDKNCYEAVGDITYVNIGKRSGPDIVTPPVIAPEPFSAESKTLKEFLESKNLEVIDKRPAGGCLWVVGDKSMIASIIQEAGKLYGAYGSYSSGGNATKRRPGWFTKCKK